MTPVVYLSGTMGMDYPTVHHNAVGNNIFTTTYSVVTLDAATEICAFCGFVAFEGRTGTKNITTITLGFAGVTPSTGSSTVRVSLQDLDATAGPPMRPDGGVDQSWTATITNIVADAVATVTVTSRTVTYGDALCVVVDFSTFSGSPILNVRYAPQGGNMGAMGHMSSKLAGTWAAVNAMGVILGFDDGTYGCLFGGAWPIVSHGTTTFNTGSAADEIGNKVTVPWPCCAEGIWSAVFCPATGSGIANYDVVLYEGAAASSVAIASCAVDANWFALVSNFRISYHRFTTIVTLTTTSTYWAAVKPTTATSIGVAQCTVAVATQLMAYPGGTNVVYASRADAGTWTPITTQRAYCGLMLCAFDSGVGGGNLFDGKVLS